MWKLFVSCLHWMWKYYGSILWPISRPTHATNNDYCLDDTNIRHSDKFIWMNGLNKNESILSHSLAHKLTNTQKLTNDIWKLCWQHTYFAASPIAIILKQATDLIENTIAWLPAKTIFVELCEIVMSKKCTVTAGIISIYIIHTHINTKSVIIVFCFTKRIVLKMWSVCSDNCNIAIAMLKLSQIEQSNFNYSFCRWLLASCIFPAFCSKLHETLTWVAKTNISFICH